MQFKFLMALLPTLLGASLAQAQELKVSQASAQANFATIDRNGDQRISKTEAGMYKHIIDRFAYIDTNGDGFISQDELNANKTARNVN